MAQLALAFDILARDKASRTFKDVGDSADRAERKISNFSGKFADFGKAVAVGVGALGVGAVVLGKGFVDAAVESQKVTKQTAAVIKSMGGVAGVSADQVAELAESLSMKSGVDDELIQSGQNVLLTFANVRNAVGKGPKVFDRATKAALDMSVALGTDMTSASMMVGKALNDPVAGLAKLSRSGVQFTKEQKEQIKTMAEAGDTAGAQAIMLDELDRQLGGSAEAQATAGDRLKVVWGNLQETLGEKLLPAVEAVATWMADALPAALSVAEDAWQTISPYVETATTAVSGFVSDALDALSNWWSNNGDNITTWFKDVGGAIGSAVADGFDALSNWWSLNGDNIATWFSNVGTILADDVGPALAAVGGFLKDDVYPGLKSVGEWIVDNEYVFEALKVVVAGAAAAWFTYATAVALAGASQLLVLAPFIAAIAIVTGLVAATDWLIERYRVGLNEAFQRVIDKAAGVLNFFRDLVRFIKDAVKYAKELIDLLPNISLPGGGGGDGWTRFLPDLPGPADDIIKGFFKANGGPVTGGLPYIVGERGPELFMPGQSGAIVPNHQLGAGGSSFVVNNEITVADTRVAKDIVHEFNVIRLQSASY